MLNTTDKLYDRKGSPVTFISTGVNGTLVFVNKVTGRVLVSDKNGIALESSHRLIFDSKVRTPKPKAGKRINISIGDSVVFATMNGGRAAVRACSVVKMEHRAVFLKDKLTGEEFKAIHWQMYPSFEAVTASIEKMLDAIDSTKSDLKKQADKDLESTGSIRDRFREAARASGPASHT